MTANGMVNENTVHVVCVLAVKTEITNAKIEITNSPQEQIIAIFIFSPFTLKCLHYFEEFTPLSLQTYPSLFLLVITANTRKMQLCHQHKFYSTHTPSVSK